MKTSFIVFIPARYASTRFPGKALAKLGGKPIIVHVLEKALAVIPDIYVATDDERIAECVRNNGGIAILTGEHSNGTSRIAEAFRSLDRKPDEETILINLQGDEPLFPSTLLKDIMAVFSDPKVNIATAVHRCSDPTWLSNPNRVKVALNHHDEALLFSRASIPHYRDEEAKQAGYIHIGVYAFRASIFEKLIALPPSRLEEIEKLEQLRWLENGYSIKCITTDYEGFGIDTPADLQAAEGLL